MVNFHYVVFVNLVKEEASIDFLCSRSINLLIWRWHSKVTTDLRWVLTFRWWWLAVSWRRIVCRWSLRLRIGVIVLDELNLDSSFSVVELKSREST